MAGAKKKGFNDYEICGEITKIFIERRNGDKYITIIDTEDLQKLIDLNYRWHVNFCKGRNCHHIICCEYLGIIDGKARYMNKNIHQILMDYNPENGEYVDHINNDGFNNRKSNLRVITNKGNLINRIGKNKNNTSGYRNVTWLDGKWIVQLQIDGKNTRLGSFDDVHEAGKFAEKMRQKYYKEVIKNETIEQFDK